MNCMRWYKVVLLSALFIFGLSTSVFADSFTIKASASPKKGGAISPSGKVTVESGENQQFIIAPNAGYQIQDVVVDKDSLGAVNGHTFTNISEKHSIKAKFTKQTFTVSVAQGGKVRISPKGKRIVQHGKILKLKITPESEDIIPILLVNGQQVETKQSGKAYRFDLTVVGDTNVFATSEIEPKLAPSTKIMDEATAQNLTSISPDQSVLTFAGITSYLESLQTDDVILSNISTDVAPYGLLRKVTNVVTDGSQVTVGTSQATFEDVIEAGNIIINKAITAADIMSFVPLTEGVSVRDPIPGPAAELCQGIPITIHTEGNNTLKIDGEICLDPKITFSMEWDWFELKYLGLDATIAESLSVDLVSETRFTLNEEIPIASIPLGAIQAGYVVIFPILNISVLSDQWVEGGVTIGVAQTGEVSFGLSYSDGDWHHYTDFSDLIDKDRWTFNYPALYIKAGGGVYAVADLSFMAYGVAGGFVGLQSGFYLDMEPLGDPWLTMGPRLAGLLGIKAGVWGWDIEKSITVFDMKVPMVGLRGNQAPKITSLIANPSGVTLGGTSTIKVVALDPEHDPLTCEWTATKGTLSSTTGCDPITWTAPATPGTASISVSVKDFIPGRSPVSSSVSIDVCAYFSIDPTSASYENVGGNGTINVTAPAGCSWTATSNAGWITIISGSTGSGNGTVTYSVVMNPSSPRDGTIATPGQTFSIHQAGTFIPVCTYSIDPTSASYENVGGNGTINVTAPAGCSWTATSTNGWITIISGSGSGNGTVSYSVPENPSLARDGTMTVGGVGADQRRTFSIHQAGTFIPVCTYSIDPTSASYENVGGNGTINVTAPAGCSWTATSTNGWITIISGSGSGNGTVSYSVPENPSLARDGTMTVGGVGADQRRTFSIHQAGTFIPVCTYGIDPTSASFIASGGTGSVDVATQAGCSWTATSNAGWITIISGSSGEGNGTVSYRVPVTVSSRTGTMTIAGKTFTVTQIR